MGETVTRHRVHFDEAIALSPGQDGRERVVIEGVTPQVDGGRFAAKRLAGEPFWVEADIFSDSADEIGANVLVTGPGEERFEVPMRRLDNDRWQVEIRL